MPLALRRPKGVSCRSEKRSNLSSPHFTCQGDLRSFGPSGVREREREREGLGFRVYGSAFRVEGLGAPWGSISLKGCLHRVLKYCLAFGSVLYGFMAVIVWVPFPDPEP